MVKSKRTKTMKRTPLTRRTPLKRGFSQLKAKSWPTMKRTKLKSRSKKRVKEDAEYERLKRKFLREHPHCKVCSDLKVDKVVFTQTIGGNTITRNFQLLPSTDVHHMARRGKHYLNVTTWLAVCRDHHDLIEAHGDWARAHGYLLTPEQRRLLDAPN